ncbi:hypothetical protein GQ53DRAFT_200095 [Thozetella sp. PMI_491]|nr:hypothetical protein GQ53DRAFT_200095 [Thozetella sp. PMI_491]
MSSSNSHHRSRATGAKKLQDLASSLVAAMDQEGNYFPFPRLTFLVDKPQNLSCTICLEPIEYGEKRSTRSPGYPALIPCGHIFCSGCILKCFEKDRRCPSCKVEYRYAECDHPIQPRVIDKSNIFRLPLTIPEGGKIADCCVECRLDNDRSAARTLCKALIPAFAEAREAFMRTGSTRDRKKMVELKVSMDKIVSGTSVRTTVEDMMKW